MSLPALALPKCVSLMSGYKGANFLYLGARNATSEEGIITFGEMGHDDVLTSSTHTRFYLDPSKKKDDEHAQLSHVRCAYNNKYLVSIAQGSSGKLLVGTADEPEEDLSKRTCTLFKLDILKSWFNEEVRSTVYQVRFTHPGLGKEVGVLSSFVDPVSKLLRESVHSEHTLYDMGEQIILPPYVAFKGDNGLYLTWKKFDSGYTFFPFELSDITDPSVVFTTYNYADGTVRMKSKGHNSFLHLTPEGYWIIPGKEMAGTWGLFKVFKFGDQFALQSIKNGNFCMRSTDDCINAGTKNFTKKARLQLEEPIITREIYNIEYHIRDHHRIYDCTNMNMATASAINRTSKENTIKSSLTITRKETSKLESTSVHKASVKASVTYTIIPTVLNGNLELGYEFTKGTIWGTTEETEKKQGIEYQVTVPAKKKVTLVVTATQARYDVPFSYTQKDKMTNGEVRIQNFDDGLFSGMNSFDLCYETKEEGVDPIPSSPVAILPA